MPEQQAKGNEMAIGYYPTIGTIKLPMNDGVLTFSTHLDSPDGVEEKAANALSLDSLFFSHNGHHGTKIFNRNEKKRVLVCSCQFPPIEIPDAVRTFGDFKTHMARLSGNDT